MSDIVICERKQADASKVPGTDIKVCPSDKGDDIIACPDDECAGEQEPLVITLSGGIGVQSGDFVSVTGGVEPYLLEITCGAIDQTTGEIDLTSSPACCGTGAITVTDVCGAVVSEQVAFPSGKFDTDPSVYPPDPLYQIGSNPPLSPQYGGCSTLANENRITYWYYEAIKCYRDKPAAAVWVVPPYTSELATCPTGPTCLVGSIISHVTRYTTAQWVC